jgi:glutamine---fructose-6-phosphate transaminase (isomerizing)
MCGIFAYLNYLIAKDRKTIIDTLTSGLSRLEYRGYDSAGLAIDGDDNDVLIYKQVGKVAALKKLVAEATVDLEKEFVSHCGMAHTRWATHGEPSPTNSHPHRSDPKGEFTVVHNGIITNYKELKTVLEKKGYMFESETDTEAVAKLAKYLYDSQKSNANLSFTALVKGVIKELVNISILLLIIDFSLLIN